MKKIYAFAAVAALAFGAYADDEPTTHPMDSFVAGNPIYLVGQGDGIGWDPAAPAELTYNKDANTYTAEVANLSMFKLSLEMGDWDTFNAAAIGCPSYGDTPGVAVKIEPWGENTMCPWMGDYTITVAADLSTLTLSTDTPNPGVKIYLRGDMNAWGSEDAWQLSKLDGTDDIYSFTCAADQCIQAGEGFKIADAGWATYNFGVEVAGDTLFLDSESTLVYNGQNILLDEEWDGVCFFQLSSGKVLFSNDKGETYPEDWSSAVSTINAENGAAVYYNLQGVRVNNPANGIFVVVKDGKAVKVVK